MDVGKILSRFLEHDGGVFRQFDHDAQEKPVPPMRSIETGHKHMGKLSLAARGFLQAPSIDLDRKNKIAFFQQLVKTLNHWRKRRQREFFEFPTATFKPLQSPHTHPSRSSTALA